MNKHKISITIIYNIDYKLMNFYYAFMDIKELMDTKLETVHSFMQQIIVEHLLYARSVCDYLHQS